MDPLLRFLINEILPSFKIECSTTVRQFFLLESFSKFLLFTHGPSQRLLACSVC